MIALRREGEYDRLMVVAPCCKRWVGGKVHPSGIGRIWSLWLNGSKGLYQREVMICVMVICGGDLKISRGER